MRIEKLALIISKLNGGLDPDQEAFQLNNPGLLKAFGSKVSVGGFRVFKTWEAGFHALVNDLEIKCSGRSKAKLPTSPTLNDLLLLFDIKEPRKPANFLSRALSCEVLPSTNLTFFLDKDNG